MDSKIKYLLENAKAIIDELTEELSKIEEKQPQIVEIQTETEELLSIKQIIRQYYITEPTFKKYRDLNMIKPVIQGRRPFFRRKDVLQLMQALKPGRYPDSRNKRLPK